MNKISKYGKIDLAVGRVLSKLMKELPKRKGHTPVSDLLTEGTQRMGPVEAGLMSGFGVNKLISGPINRAKAVDSFGDLKGYTDDTLTEIARKNLDNTVHGQTKGVYDDLTGKPLLEGSEKHHAKLYNKGDVDAEMFYKKPKKPSFRNPDPNADIQPYTGKPNRLDKILYNTAKYAPTALAAGAIGKGVSTQLATQQVEVPTGWEGGDWKKQANLKRDRLMTDFTFKKQAKERTKEKVVSNKDRIGGYGDWTTNSPEDMNEDKRQNLIKDTWSYLNEDQRKKVTAEELGKSTFYVRDVYGKKNLTSGQRFKGNLYDAMPSWAQNIARTIKGRAPVGSIQNKNYIGKEVVFEDKNLLNDNEYGNYTKLINPDGKSYTVDINTEDGLNTSSTKQVYPALTDTFTRKDVKKWRSNLDAKEKAKALRQKEADRIKSLARKEVQKRKDLEQVANRRAEETRYKAEQERIHGPNWDMPSVSNVPILKTESLEDKATFKYQQESANIKSKYKKQLNKINNREALHDKAYEADQASRRKFFGGKGINAVKETIRDLGVKMEKRKLNKAKVNEERASLKSYSKDLEEASKKP